MDFSDRRNTTRAQLQLEINYIQEGDFLISHSKDISIDGMFISTEEPSPVEEILTLKFCMEDTDQFTVKAQVIWINMAKDKKNRGMGVKFIDIPEELKVAILSFVNRVAVIENP